MKRILLFLLLAFCLLTADVQAQYTLAYNAAWQNGAYHQGYYWWYGHPYTRYRVYSCSRKSSCGCRVRCGYKWHYAQIQGYNYSRRGYGGVITADSISKGTWRGQLLDIISRRDAYEGQARASALEHNEFLETLKALGIEGNFTWDGYGYSPQYAQGFGQVFGYPQMPQAYNSQFGAPTGGTQYAYTYATDYADSYRNADIAALISRQQSYQELAQNNAASTASATGDLIDRKGQRDAEVARLRGTAELNERTIQAFGQAIAQGLQSGKPQERTITERTTITPQVMGQPSTTKSVEIQGADSGQARAMLNFGLLVEKRCVACHGSDSSANKSGLLLSAPTQLSQAIKAKAARRILAGEMPPAKDLQGNPIEPLTAEEKRLLLWGFGPPSM